MVGIVQSDSEIQRYGDCELRLLVVVPVTLRSRTSLPSLYDSNYRVRQTVEERRFYHYQMISRASMATQNDMYSSLHGI